MRILLYSLRHQIPSKTNTTHMILIQKSIFILSFSFCVCSCTDHKTAHNETENSKRTYFEIENTNDSLFRSPLYHYDTNEKFCYINQKGDTIIPYGKFHMAFSDTIVNYGIVVQKTNDNYEMIGINKKGQRLYEIHSFDNGADLMSDNTFRIIRNGKIGYANEFGEIIIKAQFDCAYPFENGIAKVAYECKTSSKDPVTTTQKSDAWIHINKKGESVKNK